MKYSNPVLFSVSYIAIFIAAVHAICVPINHLSEDDSKPKFQMSPLQFEPSPIQSIFTHPHPESPGATTTDISSANELFKLNNSPFIGNINELFNKFNTPFAGNADPELERMCKSTDYINLCLNTLSPSLNGKNDVDSVIRAAINVAMDYTKVGVSIAEKLEADPSVTGRLASTIGDCKDGYNDALDNFQEALDSLPDKDLGRMNSVLSAAITDFSDIGDFLDGLNSPLIDLGDKLVKLTSNCLAISALMNQQ
ncbi:uncharacterized protein LOC124933787 [Impatiens glandulifera]|uniref:uncharacterized protein LOC124933787 n=1 Tax=Impatiens glandulifera TaxID=253017 RepID=UPI001FB0F86C|nr:uncharacterized protein LOC124933787 [Impatiens glandulifera]